LSFSCSGDSFARYRSSHFVVLPFQIVEEAEQSKAQKEPILVEIGPRFAMNPVRIFESVPSILSIVPFSVISSLSFPIFRGSFGGVTLWENPSFVSPNALRAVLKKKLGSQYAIREKAKRQRLEYNEANTLPKDLFEDVFSNEAPSSSSSSSSSSSTSPAPSSNCNTAPKQSKEKVYVH
jgi:ribosome biogenesis protein BRX1